jgi:hypothetical protein
MNPSENEPVLQNISCLDNEQLLRVLDSRDGEYTSEAIALAQAELERRGGRARVAETVSDNVVTPKAPAAIRGIAGWLILPLVGLCVGLASVGMNVILLAKAFNAHPRMRVGIALFLCVVLLLLTAFVLYLFVRKHRWTPTAFIALALTNIGAAALLTPSKFPLVIGSCAIWIPYFLTSTRVKHTFVA